MKWVVMDVMIAFRNPNEALMSQNDLVRTASPTENPLAAVWGVGAAPGGAAAPSGSWPYSWGRERIIVARGSPTAIMMIPSTRAAIRQSAPSISASTKRTSSAPRPMPVPAMPKAIPRRRLNQRAIAVSGGEMSPIPLPTATNMIQKTKTSASVSAKLSRMKPTPLSMMPRNITGRGPYLSTKWPWSGPSAAPSKAVNDAMSEIWVRVVENSASSGRRKTPKPKAMNPIPIEASRAAAPAIHQP